MKVQHELHTPLSQQSQAMLITHSSSSRYPRKIYAGSPTLRIVLLTSLARDSNKLALLRRTPASNQMAKKYHVVYSAI